MTTTDTLATPTGVTGRGTRQPKPAQHRIKVAPLALETLQEQVEEIWGGLEIWPAESLHYALEIANSIFEHARTQKAFSMFDLQGARVESLLREVRPQCLAAVTDKTVNLSLPSPALDPASDAARLARNILIALHSTARYLVDATVWAKAPRAELPASVAPKALQQRAGRPMHDDEIALANLHFFALSGSRAVPIAVGYGVVQAGASISEAAVTCLSDFDHAEHPKYVEAPGRGVHRRRTLTLSGFTSTLVSLDLDLLRRSGKLCEAITGGSVMLRETEDPGEDDRAATPSAGKRDWYDIKKYDDAASRLQTNLTRHLAQGGVDDQATNASSVQTWSTMRVLRSQGLKAAMDHHFGPGPHNGARHTGLANELQMDFSDFEDLKVTMSSVAREAPLAA